MRMLLVEPMSSVTGGGLLRSGQRWFGQGSASVQVGKSRGHLSRDGGRWRPRGPPGPPPFYPAPGRGGGGEGERWGGGEGGKGAESAPPPHDSAFWTSGSESPIRRPSRASARAATSGVRPVVRFTNGTVAIVDPTSRRSPRGGEWGRRGGATSRSNAGESRRVAARKPRPSAPWSGLRTPWVSPMPGATN